MANIDIPSLSGTTNPYGIQSYTPESNDKNTLTITDYFKLLAAQLQNQDMSNPMDNSEMMAQMTQMAMVQSLTAMTDSLEASTTTTAQTYAAGLVGQELTVMVTEESSFGTEVPVGVKYGKVEYVSFVNGNITFKLEDDNNVYTMSHIVGVGRIPDPFAEKKSEESESDEDTEDSVEGTEGTEEV